MSKIVVECRVPAAGVRDDIAIPYEKPLAHSLELIKAVFSENESFCPDETSLLCDSETGNIYDVNRSPEELGLVNGMLLMLI